MAHEKIEDAVGGLQHHHSRVEQRGVVPHGGDIRQGESYVDVAEDEWVGVDEDESVVFGELP